MFRFFSFATGLSEVVSRVSMLSNSPSKSKLLPINSPVMMMMSEKSKETSSDPAPCGVDKRRERDQKIKTQEKNKRNIANKTTMPPLLDSSSRQEGGEILVAEKHSPKSPIYNRMNNKKRNNLKQDSGGSIVNSIIVSTSPVSSVKSISSTTVCQNVVHNKHYSKQKDTISLVNGISNSNALSDYNEICALFGQNVSLKGKKNSIDKLGL